MAGPQEFEKNLMVSNYTKYDYLPAYVRAKSHLTVHHLWKKKNPVEKV